jgi:EAL domain-containing protein (putative c-di-GMP-specific phosphodiesterase class I)
MQWQREGFGPVRVAVNLSARQFYQQDLVATIADVLLETGLPPHLLELELTESMMMTDAAQSAEILGRLKALGVHLSIDDFGTGYSSLSYLKRFPIDLLKIDQSFVRDITVDPDDAAIVTSIISLAHSLRLEVIAEGVETEAQLAYLRTHGCDCMQGYYFSRPVPHQEVAQILRHNSARPLNMLQQSTVPALSS